MIKAKTTWENLPLNLTVRQAAEIMQCDPETIKRALRSKRLKGCKLGETANSSWRIERGELLIFAKGDI